MRPGQLEVMVNRRSALSDELGNPEKMDEQEGGLGAPPALLFLPLAHMCHMSCQSHRVLQQLAVLFMTSLLP